MKENLDVLFVTCDSSLFGANKSLLNIISSVKDNLNSYYVITPYKGEFNDVLDSFGIPNYVIRFNTDCANTPVDFISKFKFNLKKLKKDVINFFATKKLVKLAKELNINFVHSNSSVLTIGFDVSQTLGIKHVWHVREFIDKDHGMMPFIGFEKYFKMISKSDFIIYISKSIFNHFNITSTEYSIIHDAVINEEINIYPEKNNKNNKYFLFCGSFTHNKGIEDALKAFNLFYRNESKEVKLKLAGSISSNPTYLSKILDLIDSLGIKENVEILGYISNIYPLMNEALALLVCSKNEALGRVTIEAMASNCIVIGYNNAGTSELIENEKTGFLYESIDELYMNLKNVYNNSEQMSEIRKLAYTYAFEEFSEDVYKQKVLTIYSSLINS